jgi:hypothetical protein
VSKAFASIKKGLEEAITHQKGKAHDAKTPTLSQSKRNIGKELVEGSDLDHTQQFEALIELLREVHGQNRPNIQFLGSLLWLLPEKPSPATISRWVRDPATGERELIVLLRPVWCEATANFSKLFLDSAGKQPVRWHAKSEAAPELEKAIDNVFRKSPSLRRLLDFSRPHETTARFIRHLREQRRKAFYKLILNSSLSIEEARRRQREWAKENLPARGRPVTYDANFMAEVNALRNRLVGGSSNNPALKRQTHRISPMQNQAGTIKDTIKRYLTSRYGRQPTATEIAKAQVAYSRLSRRR